MMKETKVKRIPLVPVVMIIIGIIIFVAVIATSKVILSKYSAEQQHNKFLVGTIDEGDTSADHVHTYVYTYLDEECCETTCETCSLDIIQQHVALSEELGGVKETITETSCTEDGEYVYTCVFCGSEFTVTEYAYGHTWSEWETTTEATCETEGVQTRTCETCGETETQTIAITGHTGGTHANGGTCTVCNTVYQQHIIQYKDNGDGTHTGTCECGYTVTESHIYEDGKCTLCSAIEDTGNTEDEHAWGDWKVTTEATCTTAGVQTRTCTVCGETQTKTIAALGHTGGTHANGGTCTVCNTVYQQHTVEYKDNEDGTHTGTCECGYTVTESHTYEDGKCTLCSAVENTQNAGSNDNTDNNSDNNDSNNSNTDSSDSDNNNTDSSNANNNNTGNSSTNNSSTSDDTTASSSGLPYTGNNAIFFAEIAGIAFIIVIIALYIKLRKYRDIH